VITETAADSDFDSAETVSHTVVCSGATPRRIGGGFSLNDDVGTVITDSFPSGGTTPGTSWTASVTSQVNNQNVTLSVYAICAP
jgi:hypothetical protein